MNRVVTFYGADHKCGTSMISLCVAKSISKLCPSLKVLLIYIDNKSSEAYSPKIGENLSRIWPYINEQILDLDELEYKAQYDNNLSIIGGINMTDPEERFNTIGCEYLFSRCRERYDIIICDAGTEITRALCFGSILASDEVNMVIAQKESALKKMEIESSFYKKMNINFSYYILNKYDRDNAYSKKYCAKRLEVSEDLFNCIADSGYGDIAEMQGKSLLDYKSVAFKRGIDNMGKRIISDYGRV